MRYTVEIRDYVADFSFIIRNSGQYGLLGFAIQVAGYYNLESVVAVIEVSITVIHAANCEIKLSLLLCIM